MSIIKQPAAFFSYSHHDDIHDGKYLTKLRKRLSGEVKTHTSKEFPIFQDRDSIEWGQNWKERIAESLQVVTFLIPIITPNYFASEACCDELRHFAEHEKNLNRNDLILPIYYVTCKQIESKSRSDELGNLIKDHQYIDWRRLRGRGQKIVKFNQKLEKAALSISSAIDRLQESQETIFEMSDDIAKNLTKYEQSSEKTSQKRLIVDKNQTECYQFINDAIMAANAGDQIVIRPGIYDESIIINKSLEIMGEGDSGSIVVKASDKSVVLSVAQNGCIKNISLKQIGGNWFCVDIPYGSIEIEECDISSQGSSCVGIHHGANPLLKQNHIHGGAQSGIFIFDNGRGVLEENDIFDNSFSGVEIRNFSNPIVRSNKIHDGKQGGVLVHNNGLGVFENNDIFKNIIGIEIREGGNPTFKNNMIHDNRENGIIVVNGGLGILEHNDIFKNGYDGVAIRSKGNPVFRHNKIRDGKTGGIFILDGGRGVLKHNNIFRNASDGVAIKSKGNPKLRHNRIYGGKSDGIYVWEGGLGIIEDNDIFENFHGVEIETNSNPTLQCNMIHENKKHGICIQNKGRGILELNEIFKNGISGVQIRDLANPILKNNKIYGNIQSGVFVHEGGSGTITNNDIFENFYSGIEIATSGNPNIFRNNIRNGKQHGVLIRDKGGGNFKNNNIVWNNYAGIAIENMGNPVISQNNINMNTCEAIRVFDGGIGRIQDNDLRGNRSGAWSLPKNPSSRLKIAGNMEQ